MQPQAGTIQGNVGLRQPGDFGDKNSHLHMMTIDLANIKTLCKHAAQLYLRT